VQFKTIMISANKAYELIIQHLGNWGSEEIPFENSVGRVIREDINADRDFPPFNRVTMDGIGISYSEDRNEFKIADLQAAGMPQKTLTDPNQCMEVMTGAICPEGIDTIIPYENIEINNNTARITIPVKKGKNIHHQGFDKTKGDVLISLGSRISTAEIGVIASVGKTKVRVSKLPRVAILSTGDELLDVMETPANYQIRKSNVWALKTDLLDLNISADMFHLPDSKDEIKKELETILSNYDAVLLSGGVSKGKLDFIPEVMESLGIEKVFHRVKQRPGKPFWFGTFKGKVQLFAFPGNPVSTYSNFHRYFIPWLNKSIGIKECTPFKLKLTEEFNFDLALSYFLQVKVVQTPEGPQAKPMKGKGSGDLANLLSTDGFLIIPEDVNHCPVGSEFDYIPFRKIGL
jgi:molybdopterin molybdotransferase